MTVCIIACIIIICHYLSFWAIWVTPLSFGGAVSSITTPREKRRSTDRKRWKVTNDITQVKCRAENWMHFCIWPMPVRTACTKGICRSGIVLIFPENDLLISVPAICTNVVYQLFVSKYLSGGTKHTTSNNSKKFAERAYPLPRLYPRAQCTKIEQWNNSRWRICVRLSTRAFNRKNFIND